MGIRSMYIVTYSKFLEKFSTTWLSKSRNFDLQIHRCRYFKYHRFELENDSGIVSFQMGFFFVKFCGEGFYSDAAQIYRSYWQKINW